MPSDDLGCGGRCHDDFAFHLMTRSRRMAVAEAHGQWRRQDPSGAAQSLQPCPAPSVMHTQTSGGPLPGCGGLPRTRGVGGLPESPSAQTPRCHPCFRIRSLPLNSLLCAALCAIKWSAAFLMVTWPLLHECRTDDLITFFLQIVLVSSFLLL